MTVANVNFPGLFFAWGKQIISGPCWESIERTVKLGGAIIPKISFKPENHWDEQIKLNRFIYTSVLFEMCEEAGVEVLCNCMVSDVINNESDLTVIITDKKGLSAIKTKTAIDATGDANLVEMAELPVVKNPELQPATLQNHISGYILTDRVKKEIRDNFHKSGMPEYITAEDVIEFLEIEKIDMHIPCGDADTSKGKTQLEKSAFSMMLGLYKFLREIPGLENIEIDFVAEETGIRETNRILGENIITAEEYINGSSYNDSICYAFYPIDRHIMSGIENSYHKENVVSEVPYSALIPKGSERILCAGRCLSSDVYANSALRVEAVCMATGQAAGCAAAIAAVKNIGVQNVSYDELCNALKAINAIVPN